ncbi:MAG: glycosidase [Planctomycetota bacterium]
MPLVKLTRHPANPILGPIASHPWEDQNVSNAAAVIHNGKVHILYRAEGHEKRVPYTKAWPVTSLGLAMSSDGVTIDERLDEPVITKEPIGQFGEHGHQDPRIAKIGDTYYIMSATVSRWGDRLHLFTTKDFKSFKNCGPIQPEHEMRTAGLFPEKINGRYCGLFRYAPNMWVSYSDDLKTWTDTKLLLEVKRESWYGRKLGIGATPIKQDNAWLLFWHGKDDTLDEVYSLGVMWLDLNDPSKILRFQKEPILTVEKDYEKTGYWPNVVYTCGVVELNGLYHVYYGCADRVLALATVPVEDCRL